MPVKPPADRLVRAYRARLAAVHALIERQIERLYGDVDPDAIEASFAAFVAQAAVVIEMGQQTTSALAAAFIRTYGFSRTGRLIELDDDEEAIAGTRAGGTPIAEGMAPFASMVLGRIGDGVALVAAMDFGRYLATRYADGELTSAADRMIEQIRRKAHTTAWEGVVAADSCERCQVNDGVHPIDVEVYRHPGCNCLYVPLIDVAA